MATAEQNGIDILCDAAGSDMLLSSLFALAAPHDQRAQTSQQHEEQDSQHPLPSSPSKHHAHPQSYRQVDPAQQETPRRSSSSLPSKRKLSDHSISSPSHVCHICRRVYERADHLTRHLRSHENARPYQCSRCPKRFNRADLLTRHETTHDRDGAAKDRPFIRRSDRAAEACLNCAASKAKCEDQKPCSRCRNKSLACQMPTKRGSQYRTESQSGMSPSETPNVSSIASFDNGGGFTAGDAAHVLAKQTPSVHGQIVDPAMGYTSSSFLNAPSMDASFEDLMCFAPVRKLFKDLDYQWDSNFDSFSIPLLDVGWQSPQLSKQSLQQAERDTSRESVVSNIATQALGQGASANLTLRLDLSAARDRLFAMVLSCKPTPQRIPSFPSLPLLNHLMDLYFTHEEQRRDELLHKPSFDPSVAGTELLSAIIASGAPHVSAPSIWQFGLALDDIVRAAITRKLDNTSSTQQDLALLQACIIHLEIGLWGGISRKMELAESLAPQILTLLRRTNAMSFSRDSTIQPPSIDDSADMLHSKWKQFVVLESYKRLIIRLFLYDVQSSVTLCKPPLMSYNELDFSPPACRDLWKAESAEEWRQVYLRIPVMETTSSTIIPEVRRCSDLVAGSSDWFDGGLLDTVYSHGFWGQIWSYRDIVRSLPSQGLNAAGKTSRPWMDEMRDELYFKLFELSRDCNSTTVSEQEPGLTAELFMMVLHASPNDLQKLAGRNGEAEARKMMRMLEEAWFSTPAARSAVWRAGQIVRQARSLPSQSLQGFRAMAVYFASLTLWAWGLIYRSVNVSEADSDVTHVLVDDEISDSLQRFLKLGEGVPAIKITMSGGTSRIEPLSNVQAVLLAAQSLFGATQEPMLPFVECLSQHLGELASRQGS